MFFKSKQGMTISIITTLFMGVCMALTAMALGSADRTIWSFLSTCGTVSWLILVLLVLLPIPQWGNQIATTLGCKPGSFVFTLVSGILPALIFNTENAAIMAAINIFGSTAIPEAEKLGIWWSSLLHDWPIMLIVAYIASIIAGILGNVVAKANS